MTAHRQRRRLSAATFVVLVAGAVTAATAVGLFVGARAAPLVTVHLVAAAAFFAALGVKLALLGARARPGRGRRLWRLLVAQLGGALAAYTLVTGVLVVLDPAWSDQHLAAAFWLGVVVVTHTRHYARRLRPVGSAAGPQVDLRAELRARRSPSRRLVVVGGGMAGHALVEHMAGRERWDITLLAEEEAHPYNRIALSAVLRDARSRERLLLRPSGWYADAGVELRLGATAVAVDLDTRRVTERTGVEHRYDALVLATGSRPFIPPIPGAQLDHVSGYRTLRDAERIAAASGRARTAAVIGGGLLGLEAAAALASRGVAVTVIETAHRLMPQQLDDGASSLLRRALLRLGVETIVGATVSEITASSVMLADRRSRVADLVVVATGIRAETTLARAAGLEVDRGIVVDDQLRASAPGTWAVGECAQHRGVVHGLWAPVTEQVRAAVASVDGDPLPLAPSTAQTTLKVPGLAPLLGDTAADGRLRDVIAAGGPFAIDVPGRSDATRLVERPPREPRRRDDVVCHCMGVSRGRVERAIDEDGADSVDRVAAATGAGTGCGSCAGTVTRIIDERARFVRPRQPSAGGASANRSDWASA